VNVYQMYIANGCKVGFWLTRTTWVRTCARVVFVEDLNHDKAPYYGNPAVRADIHDSFTGELKDSSAIIPVPGTYKTWRLIEPPAWACGDE
jgi:hypothetical protein